MSPLPIVGESVGEAQPTPRSRRASTAHFILHLLRVGLFVAILLCIRFSGNSNPRTFAFDSQPFDLNIDSLALDFVDQQWVGSRLKPYDAKAGGYPVQGADGLIIGNLLDSVQGHPYIGYSGPTRCLLLLDTVSEIKAVQVHSSGDTVDHVKAVIDDERFLNSFQGIRMGENYDWQSVDTVSGATLTSHAILSTIADQMGSDPTSLKFELRPNLENVRKIFASAKALDTTEKTNCFNVLGREGEHLGQIITSTPIADNISGYQGPSAMLLGLDSQQICSGIALDQSYDNLPYTGYLDDDYVFPSLFLGKSLESIAQLELGEIEGISGATMTSQAAARILVTAAKDAIESGNRSPASVPQRDWRSYVFDGLTILLTLTALSFSFVTKKVQRTRLRIGFQILVVVIIGFLGGQMMSQAQWVGWASHGIPWTVAPGLVVLTMAALAVPVFSRQQTYCQHLCPMGAIQQWTSNRLFRRRLGRRIHRYLKWTSGTVVAALLGWVVYVGVQQTEFNLASLEAFDGFSFRVAGWAALTILIAGLCSSLFVPMAYCRFGCPTGRVLGFLKFRSDSHRIGMRDIVAVLLLLLALSLR